MKAPLRGLAATSVLALAGTLISATPAQGVPDPSAAESGASWLVEQLTVGGLLPSQFDDSTPDVGLSIDAGFSLAQVGGHADSVLGVADGMDSQAGRDYVAYEGFGYVGRAANATGKALSFLQSLPVPRSTVDGIDLVEQMEELTLDSGPQVGRVLDQNTQDGEPAGDFSNTLGQAFAARGLAAAGSDEASAARDFLLRQQCPAGGFRLSMAAAGATTGLSCTDNTDADNDTTAIVVQQLVALEDPAVAPAVAEARSWLLSRQQADGSWGGSGAETASNSNSTGLAADALGAQRLCRPAAPWLAGLQVPDGATAPLAGQDGALAYNQAALTAAQARGIGVPAAGDDGDTTTEKAAIRDQWRRVMAQALPALAQLQADSTGAAPSLTAPSRYARAGGALTLTIGDLVAGEVACLTGPGLTGLRQTAAGSTLTRRVGLPPGQGVRTYRVVTGDGDVATTSVRALGQKRLAVSTNKARVKRSGALRTVVRGLAAGERVQVRFKGRTVRAGAANPRGVFVASFRAERQTGVKRVVAVGEFPAIRRGTDTVRVVR